ncbi:protealysin inhibitor emfourin [Actinomadura violacea]|uniref:protealysin inhibitor emfourin n=1 Tax=Actinomadura violacea TaxID=2819934 RepID=UPI001E3AEE01|nr:protealysin inhibitor emfourin [Actinomadura violacea]
MGGDGAVKVTVVRSGGFAGIRRRGEADSATDPMLARLAGRVDLSSVPPPGRIPDQFVYDIDIDGRHATVGEAQLSGPLRELVHHVLGTGRPGG